MMTDTVTQNILEQNTFVESSEQPDVELGVFTDFLDKSRHGATMVPKLASSNKSLSLISSYRTAKQLDSSIETENDENEDIQRVSGTIQY